LVNIFESSIIKQIYSGTCYLETRVWIEILFSVSKAEPKVPTYPIRSTYLMRCAAFSPKWCFRSSQVTSIRKTISSPTVFLAILAFQSLLKGQKYKGSLANVGVRLSNVDFRLFSLSVFSRCISCVSKCQVLPYIPVVPIHNRYYLSLLVKRLPATTFQWKSNSNIIYMNQIRKPLCQKID
jgi:hypothetical protein